MSKAYPEQPRSSCHALVHRDGMILLVQRAAEPFQGYWGLPGGSVELGETLQEAVVREVAEETGAVITPNQYLGYKDAIDRDSQGRVQFHYVIHYFLAGLKDGHIKPGSDAAKSEWIEITALETLPVTDSVYLTLRAANLLPRQGV